jgi:hypothetical protein
MLPCVVKTLCYAFISYLLYTVWKSLSYQSLLFIQHLFIVYSTFVYNSVPFFPSRMLVLFPKKYYCFPLVTMLTCINFHANFMWFIMPGCGAAWSKVPDLSRRDSGWRFGLGDDARTAMACGMLGPRVSSRCPISIFLIFNHCFFACFVDAPCKLLL